MRSAGIAGRKRCLLHATNVAALLTVLALVICEASASAENAARRVACEGADATVEGDDAAHRDLVCAGVRHALRFLGTCGIKTDRPVSVRIENEVSHPCGTSLYGRYDRASDAVTVARLSSCRAVAAASLPLPAIDFEDWYRGLVAHEVSHAVLTHADREDVLGRLGQEYIASVVQIEAVSGRDRQTVLNRLELGAPMDTAGFSLAYMAMDPVAFALQAHRHYQRQGEACTFLRDLLRGDIRFRSRHGLQ